MYATSMAMAVTMLVSLLFFGLRPGLQMLLGTLTSAISIFLYYVSPASLSAPAFQVTALLLALSRCSTFERNVMGL